MTIAQFNLQERKEKAKQLQLCCGSQHWIELMCQKCPFATVEELLLEAEIAWKCCTDLDWKEAFLHHPKIGDLDSLRKKFLSTAVWASSEQASVNSAADEILQDLKKGNEEYESKFGFIFIICATGKSAGEMLHMLKVRLANDPADEIKIAMQEQAKITHLRLEKLLS